MFKYYIHKLAFTLAEVLIVIGIIGIIADMTIPTLKRDIDKIVFVTQLKKFYSIYQQGMKMIMAEEGVSTIKDTGLTEAGYNNTDLNKFKTLMEKAFNITKICRPSANCNFPLPKYRYFSGEAFEEYSSYYYTLVSLSDGTNIYINYSTPTCSVSNGVSYCGSIDVDINGYKKPNIMGRDLFGFLLDNNGNLHPYGGTFHAKIASSPDSDYHWEKTKSLCGEKGKPIPKDGTVHGEGCAARIMENGWVMDY